MENLIHGYAPSIINSRGRKFGLQLITDDFIFYADIEEGDENANTIMLMRNMELRSDNYFAYMALAEEFEKPQNDQSFIWQSEEFKESHAIQKQHS